MHDDANKQTEVRDSAGVPGAGHLNAVVVEGPCDSRRLLALLAEVRPAARADASGGSRTVLRGLGIGLSVDPRGTYTSDPEWWAASQIHRGLRTVADAAACTSPGLETVLDEEVWTHPGAWPADGEAAPVAADGVIVFKPGVSVLSEMLTELADRLAECGYRASRARILSGDDIRRQDLASHHYRPHVDLAERGVMSVQERAAFLRLYDRPEFVERFGARAWELPVLPAREVIGTLGVPAALLDRWSQESTLRHGLDSGAVDGPNGIGDCLYVNVFQDPGYHGGQAFVVLNPHLPGVLDQLRAATHQAVAVLVHAQSRTPLPWHRMRREFCGSTDPARALPGSLRGDAWAGVLPLRNLDGTPVQRTNNGVHLSNGAVEALQDAMTWFGLRPGRTAVGQSLRRMGLDPERLLESPFVVLDGQRRAVQEVTDGLDAAAAARALRGGRLLAHCDEWDDERSLRLVDAAWRASEDLRRDPSVKVLIVHGSAGRGRTTSDSEAELLAVRDGPAEPSAAGGRTVGHSRAEAVGVRTDHLELADAERLVAGPPDRLADLPGVARLAGVVLWEREGAGTRLRGAAVGLRVPPAALHEELDGIERLLARAPVRADPLREASLALATLVLNLRPMRCHTMGWLLTDLDRAGESELREALLDIWSAREADAQQAREAVESAGALLCSVRSAPSPDTLRTARQLLAEARGQLGAGRAEQAVHCARLAAWSVRAWAGSVPDGPARYAAAAAGPQAPERVVLAARLTQLAFALRSGRDSFPVRPPGAAPGR
ncbi:hypothetical protein [Streptomyces sp. ME19-01-6]|uniref:hypothetical protein n=1 Tax=Streptomyces sp. ME19-01-6 TaxID=3028686 RepID=UPI0029AE0647|nr:hypothetical protein [Streptomyces sp. ME19-01-6]MDX3230407.1 hypothetical protein [Streptomyces sp. ME19-01-6]